MGSLRPFIEARRCDGVKAKTINLGLGVVRHILNVAASEWACIAYKIKNDANVAGAHGRLPEYCRAGAAWYCSATAKDLVFSLLSRR
jgi:hypothetical protein